jgi:hypothetical protein
MQCALSFTELRRRDVGAEVRDEALFVEGDHADSPKYSQEFPEHITMAQSHSFRANVSTIFWFTPSAALSRSPNNSPIGRRDGRPAAFSTHCQTAADYAISKIERICWRISDRDSGTDER